MPAPFDPRNRENWIGGHYEAAMVLGSTNSPEADARLLAAITGLWSRSSLRALALGDLAAWDWTHAPVLATRALGDLHRIYGVFDHGTLGRLPFTSLVVREEIADGEDWLYACVPLGGLKQGDGFPFRGPEHAAAARSWRGPLERALADLVLGICETVPIQMAAIGFEVAGLMDRSREPADMPRHMGYVCRGETGYRYWPTTEW